MSDLTLVKTFITRKEYNAKISAAGGDHTHAISDITTLQTTLDGKADDAHTHEYASTLHGHVISDVTGLQTELSGKADNVHTHDYAASNHNHAISDITNLQTDLGNKSDSNHTHDYAASTHAHAITDVTNLQTTLSGKQDALVSGTNIKTVNSTSILGSGDIVISGADPRITQKQVMIESDFFNASTSAIYGILGVAISSGTVGAVAAESNHPGIIYIRDSTTANGGYRFMTDINSFLLTGGMKTEFVFQIRGVRAGMKCRLGWHDSTATQTAPVDGTFLDCIGNGTTLTFTGKCRSNNSETVTGTSYTASINTWYRLVIEVISTSLVRFTVYNDSGNSLWTQDVTTNIPTASGRDTGWGVIAGETSTDAAADIIRLDYARLENTTSLQRGVTL